MGVCTVATYARGMSGKGTWTGYIARGVWQRTILMLQTVPIVVLFHFIHL